MGKGIPTRRVSDPRSERQPDRRIGRRGFLAGLGATTAALALTPPRGPAHAVSPIVAQRSKRLSKGLNASLWMEWLPGDPKARANQLAKYQAQDFAQIRALGFDHIRVSLHPNFLAPQVTSGDPTLSRDNLAILDEAMSRILKNDLAVVLDCHPAKEFKDKLAGDPKFVTTVADWWQGFAGHVASTAQYNPERTFLELLNEPEESMDDPQLYRGIIERLAAGARRGAPSHTIIAGGNRMNVPEALFQGDFQPLADANMIYTFHFYQPLAFTHQAMPGGYFYSKLKGIPWDIDANGMSEQEIAKHDPDTQKALREYIKKPRRKWDLIWYFDELRKWRDAHDQFVWLGEFGVHFPAADPKQRAAWIGHVRELCEERGFGWCMWEARGGFGLFYNGNERPLRPMPEVLAALGVKPGAAAK